MKAFIYAVAFILLFYWEDVNETLFAVLCYRYENTREYIPIHHLNEHNGG